MMNKNKLVSIISEHNYLNGFKFVIAEFGVFILIILPFTLYYLIHRNLLFGLIGSGLVSNFVTVILFAFRSIRKRETSIGVLSFYKKKNLAELKHEYPDLSKHTFILFICLLVPFLLTVGVCIELLF
jgi:Na+/melibiose symporter-like transporter